MTDPQDPLRQELEEIEAVLKRIQRFDPVGVAAKDLRDCLLIQLSQFSKETPWLDEARLIISDHLDLLANHDFRSLMRVTRLKEEVLKEAVNLIQSLDPRPGQSIQTKPFAHNVSELWREGVDLISVTVLQTLSHGNSLSS